MKKLITLVAIIALSTSGFAMSQAPASDGGAQKECAMKEAPSCCTTDGSCKTEGACGMKKNAEKAAGCAGGTCPLPK